MIVVASLDLHPLKKILMDSSISVHETAHMYGLEHPTGPDWPEQESSLLTLQL